MRFVSTKNPEHKVELKEAILQAQPIEGGLYLPETITPLPQGFWDNWKNLSFPELSFQIASQILGDSIPPDDLKPLINQAIDFPAPLHHLTEKTYILELFHGPTLAFKDFGARFMARLISYLTRDSTHPTTLLVATSGDTGGAVANAFLNVPKTRVVILYPQGGVSPLQEKQLTTLGANITALEVEGSFDDCQRLVKQAFTDKIFAEFLSSANSINLARLIPQMFYYFEALRQLPHSAPVVVVPSGNLGNLTAGLIAKRLGLPVKHFVAACNANRCVVDYLETGDSRPRPSIATLSNAMDVGDPSNFVRIQSLYQQNWDDIKQDMTAYSFDDQKTRQAITEIYQTHQYVVDPHTAVGWLAAQEWKQLHSDPLLILSTAHPAKFLPVVEQQLGTNSLSVPLALAQLAKLPKQATSMINDYPTFKTWLATELA